MLRPAGSLSNVVFVTGKTSVVTKEITLDWNEGVTVGVDCCWGLMMATSTTVVDDAVSCSNRRRHDEDELQYVVVFPRVMGRILSVHC